MFATFAAKWWQNWSILELCETVEMFPFVYSYISKAMTCKLGNMNKYAAT